MKSKIAREYLDERYKTMFLMSLSESIKAVELAEAEMVEKAAQLFEQFMSGVFQGDTPKKMAEEFKQKLME